MKICPLCDQKYADDSLDFCLIDGSGLTQLNKETPTVDLPANYQPYSEDTITNVQTSRKANIWKWILLSAGGLFLFSAGVFVGKSTSFLRDENNYLQNQNVQSETSSGSGKTDDAADITPDKFKKIENGMTLEQINEIVGKSGIQISVGNNDYTNPPTKTMIYQWGNNNKFIMVGFINDKSFYKSNNGLVE